MIEKISVKKFSKHDSKFLFNVYNYSVRKGFSTSNKTTKYNEHKKWIKLKLRDRSTKIYICSLNDKKIGYVRFEELKKKIYKVSIANHFRYIGKGLGSQTLKLAIRKFVRYLKPFKMLSAVKKNNIASQKIFLKNNFKLNNKINIKKFIEASPKKSFFYEYSVKN